MNRRLHIVLLSALIALPALSGAETLLVERVGDEAKMALPARGMSMRDVKSSFGAPVGRMDPRGGQKRQWPTINRWSYPNFIVYFENDKVIDAVVVQADPTQTGPKPPIR